MIKDSLEVDVTNIEMDQDSNDDAICVTHVNSKKKNFVKLMGVIKYKAKRGGLKKKMMLALML